MGFESVANNVLLKTIIDESNKLNEKMQQSLKATAPIVLLKAMNGIIDKTLPTLKNDVIEAQTSAESIENAKGMLGLSKDNILDIYTYVRHGMILPVTVADADLKLGYKTGDYFCQKHPEFAPQKFVDLYTPIKTHASRWNALKDAIVSEGNRISVYGTSFVSHSDFVLRYVRQMDIFQTVDETEGLSQKDKKVMVRLTSILEEWQDETNQYKQSTEKVLKDLTEYNVELRDGIKPDVDNMQGLLKNLNISAEMTKLQTEIDLLNEEIDAKQEEYDTNVGLAFTGAAGMVVLPVIGVVTWAITGGIFGAKAEELRKERNNKIAERNTKQIQLEALNAVSSHVMSVSNDVVNLNLAITNAVVGLTNLHKVWDQINEFIGVAKENLNKVTCKSDLMDFDYYVSTANKAWSEVPDLATGMLELFNEAYKEANK